MSVPVLTTVDTNAAKESARRQYMQNSGVGGFDQTLNTISYMSGVTGPVVSESLFAAGKPHAASIVSAAFNAAAGPAGMANMSTLPGGARGGTSQYVMGGSQMAHQTVPGAPGQSGNPGGAASDVVLQAQANTEAMLVLQFEMNRIQTETTALSQAEAARHRALQTAINNMPVR